MKEKTCFVCGKPYDVVGMFQYYYSPVVANPSQNIVMTSGNSFTLGPGTAGSVITINGTTTTVGPSSSVVFTAPLKPVSVSVVETMTRMNKNNLCDACSSEIREHLINVEEEVLYKEAMNQVKKDRIKKRGFIYGWEEKRKKRNNTEDTIIDSD